MNAVKDNIENNKRLAKNTMVLYVRMVFMIGISLLSFRILLQELGEVDYGIYTVVAGLILFFSFLGTAMTQATGRFLSFFIGKEDAGELNRVFSMCVNAHLGISLIIILFAETIGLWFLNTQMKFPAETSFSVNVLYQCSLLTLVIQIMQIPYQAAIISYERMSVYAVAGVADIILKFCAVGILLFFEQNHLIIYALGLTVVAIVMWLGYHRYSLRNFSICEYKCFWDRKLFTELASFTGWNVLGGLGGVVANQGINTLFNLFCVITVNAAWGIANQVFNAVNLCVSNFQTAFIPQIIKYYAVEEYEEFYGLVFRSSRISFLLTYVVAFPLSVGTLWGLELWLVEIPEYTVVFTQLMIVLCVIEAFSNPLLVAIQSVGRIRNYMLSFFFLMFLNLPIAYLLLSDGGSPVIVMEFRVIVSFVVIFLRVAYLHRVFMFPWFEYAKSVLLRVLSCVLCSFPFLLVLTEYEPFENQPLLGVIIATIVAIALGYCVLLTQQEQKMALMFLRRNIVGRDGCR